MRRLVNRRAFLKNTTLSLTGLLMLKNGRSAYSYEANERLNVALIGVGEPLRRSESA
jgi:hypothetical protein